MEPTTYSDGSYSYRNVSDGGHLRNNVYVDKSENMFVHSSSASKEQGQHSFYQTNQGDRSYVSKKTGEYHKWKQRISHEDGQSNVTWPLCRESQSCTLFQLFIVRKAQSFDFEDLLVKRTWSDPELYRRTEAVFCWIMDQFDRSLTRTCINGMSWAVWIFECSALNFFIDCNPYSVENKGIENRSSGDFDRAWKARLRGDHEGFSGKPPPPPPMESHPSPGQSTREMRSLQINQCCCWSNTIIKTN